MSKMHVCKHRKNNTKARHFYKSCGFEEDSVLSELDLIGPTEK